MKILLENMDILSNVFDILTDISSHDEVIQKVRWSPSKNKIILDLKFNKAIEIFVKNGKLVIKGETNYGKYIQNILNKYSYD